VDYFDYTVLLVFLAAHIATVLGARSMVRSVASEMKAVALEREETLRQKQSLDEYDPLKDDNAITWTYGDA
jgi:hypothetical protein